MNRFVVQADVRSENRQLNKRIHDFSSQFLNAGPGMWIVSTPLSTGAFEKALASIQQDVGIPLQYRAQDSSKIPSDEVLDWSDGLLRSAFSIATCGWLTREEQIDAIGRIGRTTAAS